MTGRKSLITDFTSGPIFVPLLKFSLPFMLSNAMQVLYTLVDMYFVGHYLDVASLSAVTNASRLVDFFIAACMGLAMGGQIYIAQLIGQKRRGELNRTIGTIFTFLLALGAVMSVAGVLCAPWLVAAINVPAAARHGAVTYITTCCSGLVFSYGYNMVSSVLRGMGDSKRPFYFVAIASVLNIVLDFVFIAKCGMGVFGAALATILGQAASFVFAVIFLYRRREAFGFDFRPSSFRIDRPIFRAILRLGILFAIRFSAINISMMFVQSLVNGAGATGAARIASSAVFGAGVKLDDIVTKVTLGVMQATTGMVGQNLGARQFGRIRRTVSYAWLVSLAFYAAYTAILLADPREMFSLVTDKAEVLDLAPLFARIIVWQFPGLVIMRGTNGFLNGIGNAKLALIFGLLDGVILRIGCSWFLGDVVGLGFSGYILGYAIACYGTSIPSLIYFLFCPWERRKAVTA